MLRQGLFHIKNIFPKFKEILRLNNFREAFFLSNKDEATREILASQLGELKDKYSQLEESFTELKKQAALDQTQGLVPANENQEAYLEAASELGHS